MSDYDCEWCQDTGWFYVQGTSGFGYSRACQRCPGTMIATSRRVLDLLREEDAEIIGRTSTNHQPPRNQPPLPQRKPRS